MPLNSKAPSAWVTNSASFGSEPSAGAGQVTITRTPSSGAPDSESSTRPVIEPAPASPDASGWAAAGAPTSSTTNQRARANTVRRAGRRRPEELGSMDGAHGTGRQKSVARRSREEIMAIPWRARGIQPVRAGPGKGTVLTSSACEIPNAVSEVGTDEDEGHPGLRGQALRGDRRSNRYG